MDELTIAFKIESPPSWLPIGRTAENNWRTVEIDCSYWFNMNANGEVVLMYKPGCGMSPYPLQTERDGDNIVWRPKSGELVEGVGRLQAFFEVGTDVIGSSDMISCEVDSSLLGVDPGTDPGQTDLPWALDIIEQIAELSGHYPKIENGVLYVWDSEQEDWVQFQGGGGSATDAVLYTPQTLTTAQQEQARSNIGIEYMTEEDIEEMWGDVLPSDEFTKLSDLMQKCRLVTDSSPNLWNPETKQVGLITANGRVYTGGSYDNYRYNEITGISVGDTIDCYEFYSNRWVKKQIMRIAAFDANGTAIDAKGSNATLDTYTVPDGIVKIWVCLATTQTQIMALVNATETPTEYIEYGSVSQYYIATEEFLPAENFVVNLPSDLYALVGYELNVYFENLVEDWTKYEFNVNCDKGMQLERGYCITPTADDVGNYTLSIKISNGKDSTTVSATLHVIAASANSGVTKTVMVLGDSTTNNGIAVTKLNENFTNDVMHITLVGTRGTAPNLHEGRSGWKFSSYFSPPNAGDIAAGVENPWYNPTTQTFDASYYFTNTGITKPDWLFINLGINDVFGLDKDSTLETEITNCESLCDSMISSIKSASPSTKIGLCLTIPPNHSQDAFGKAYKCGQTRNRYKRNNLLWVNALIEEYDNRKSDGIYLIPIYTNLDTVYNMGMETLPVNARNTAVTYESPILNGGVHPVSSGYWQIADVYTAFLKGQ